jgi:hypothetical protein
MCARFCLFCYSSDNDKNDMYGTRVTSSLQNPTLEEHDNHRELISAHDEPLSVAMRVLLLLLAVVENGYD